MPIYEYLCKGCRRRVSLIRRFNDPSPPLCPHCGSQELNRLLSTFIVHRSWKDTYEDVLSDSQLMDGLMRNDPRALAEWSKRISRGEEISPQYEEMLQKMQRGEMPSAEPEEE